MISLTKITIGLLLVFTLGFCATPVFAFSPQFGLPFLKYTSPLYIASTTNTFITHTHAAPRVNKSCVQVTDSIYQRARIYFHSQKMLTGREATTSNLSLRTAIASRIAALTLCSSEASTTIR